MPQYVALVLVASVPGRAPLVVGTDKAPPLRLLSGLNLNSNYLTLLVETFTGRSLKLLSLIFRSYSTNGWPGHNDDHRFNL
jgi:hypothetical protein